MILSIDRKPVREPKDVVAAIRKAHESGAKSVLLYVVARRQRALRGGAARDLVTAGLVGRPSRRRSGLPGATLAPTPETGHILALTGACCRCTC